MDIVIYNDFLRKKFEQEGGIDVLLRYVVSETCPPIADYRNAIKLIRENKKNYRNSILLIIGADLISQWTQEENDLLDALNEMRDELSDKELAIMHYLNANHIYWRDSDYVDNPAYQDHIMHSMQYQGPFVENRLLLANYYHRSKAPLNVEMLKEAIKNVVHVSYSEDFEKMSDEAFADPQMYINEFILGIERSYVNYESLLERAGVPIERHNSSSL